MGEFFLWFPVKRPKGVAQQRHTHALSLIIMLWYPLLMGFGTPLVKLPETWLRVLAPLYAPKCCNIGVAVLGWTTHNVPLGRWFIPVV